MGSEDGMDRGDEVDREDAAGTSERAESAATSEQPVSATCAAYDVFADFYATYWGELLRDHALHAFDMLVAPRLEEAGGDPSDAPSDTLSDVPSGTPPADPHVDPTTRSLRLIDLCCGTGELAAFLSARGHDVLGLDGSPRMLERAETTAPDARFQLADARTFTVETPADALLCMYDSLNHLGDSEELSAVFRRVHAALRPGGVFLFDLNMRDGFQARFEGAFGFVEDDRSLLVRADFDEAADIGRYELTLFRRDVRLASGPSVGGTAPTWTRTDATLEQRCFDEDEVRVALTAAGFGELSVFDAEAALGMDGHIGRAMFVARRSAESPGPGSGL